MSVQKFQKLVRSESVGKADVKWFPKWVQRYAEFVRHDGPSDIPLTRELAVGFSRGLLASKVPAWQRQQAVRALAAYRSLILRTHPRPSMS